MNEYTINGYTRISKAKAKKIWSEKNIPVYACPCNMRPGEPEYPEIWLPTDTNATFAQLTNAATKYKCHNHETGLYLAYYVADCLAKEAAQ